MDFVEFMNWQNYSPVFHSLLWKYWLGKCLVSLMVIQSLQFLKYDEKLFQNYLVKTNVGCWLHYQILYSYIFPYIYSSDYYCYLQFTIRYSCVKQWIFFLVCPVSQLISDRSWFQNKEVWPHVSLSTAF